MRDKSNRKMKSSTDSSDFDRKNQRTRQARGSSATSADGDLIDLSNDKKHNTMKSTQEDVEDSFSDDTPASKEKSSIFTQAWQVIGISPMLRGNPQKPHATNIDQQINTRCKLEEDFVALQKTCETLKKEGRDVVSENKQLQSELKDAQDEHEKTRARARSLIKSAKARNESLKSDLEIASEEVSDLRSEITTANEKVQAAEVAAAEDISRLTSYIDAVKQEFFEEKQSSLQEIQQLRSQIELLNEKNDKFRQMLIPVSDEQVLDATVVRKYTSLRSGIVALVRGTWKLKLRKNLDVGGFSRDQHRIFMSSSSGSYDRLRYVVFHFICHPILSGRNYFLKDDFELFEQDLQKVENGLCEESPSENGELLMVWRNASLKVTEPFRGDGSRLSRVTQSSIWTFLDPLEIVDAAAEAKGKKKLEELCDAAIDFSLTIRQLRDYFEVDDMERAVDHPIAHWGTFTEEMATVPAGGGKQPGTIAYVIAGALTKRSKENWDQILVLEKAEVAVYR